MIQTAAWLLCRSRQLLRGQQQNLSERAALQVQGAQLLSRLMPFLRLHSASRRLQRQQPHVNLRDQRLCGNRATKLSRPEISMR